MNEQAIKLDEPISPAEAKKMVSEYCEMIRKLKLQEGPLPDSIVYAGAEDFLLKHGKWYEPVPWEGRKGAPKCCFGNSLLHSVTNPDMRYVEGIALTCFGFPTHHGWNADSEGHALDSTWRPEGLAYFGVEFSPGRAWDAIWTGDANVLQDWRRDYKIFREPWTGEDYSKWPKVTLDEMITKGFFEP